MIQWIIDLFKSKAKMKSYTEQDTIIMIYCSELFKNEIIDLGLSTPNDFDEKIRLQIVEGIDYKIIRCRYNFIEEDKCAFKEYDYNDIEQMVIINDLIKNK